MNTAPAGPLAGVRILDLTTVILGPFATQILAQLGAEVIKVETPEGDNMRHVGPMRHAGMGHIFLHANAGKQSIVLDLKHPDGREAALKLAEGCDVLISNVRPQAMARLGLDYEAVRARNPRLIHVSCCGFDQEGPDAARPAYDDLIQGATGIPWLMQQYGAPEPAYAPTTLSDRVTGLHAVYAVTAALYAREKTGQGQAIVVPMFEAMAQFVLGDHMAGLTFEPPLGEPGYARLLTTHRKPYATADGMLCVLIYNDKHWRSFFAAIGESEGLARDERFATHGARAAHIDAVYAEVARILRTRTTAEWQALLDAADVPHMPMNSPAELLANPQLRATGFVSDTVHPTEGPMHALAHPTRWSATPPAREPAHAPRLGQHTRALLAQAGYSHEQIDALLASGACLAPDSTGEPT
ncbi:CoA transferase [Ottowia sp.]|jgi:crotonobetainyl-CoA:carnitine CoA-transferase CaiB-like acyl-CoA transferase|uniref:CaiB/BaiF CoA transferase family protein n=1 Tax=Ottowia sp. TaxID=1898956 RepID=UPI0025DC3A26|nr:CoA transferase [Ottowia sp.]MBK6614669.1 CoA transferase [Ottowia sp.]MBK6745757.1 CoA transferase [Ottowia sp.]